MLSRITSSLFAAILMLCVTCAYAQTPSIKFDDVKKVETAKIDDTVRLLGTVEEVTKSFKDNTPHSFILLDATGKTRVCIWANILSKVSGADKLNKGEKVEVKGTVRNFRNKNEVHILDPKNLKIGVLAGVEVVEATPTPGPTKDDVQETSVTKIKMVTRGLMNQKVTVEAMVGGVLVPGSNRAPYTVNLSDGSGAAIDAVIWSNEAKILPAIPAKGETWRVTGTVGEYRNALQISADNAKGWKKLK